MARRTVMNCDEILAFLDTYSENKGNWEDNLSWLESDVDLDATSDSDSEQNAILSYTGDANSLGDKCNKYDTSGVILGKDGYKWLLQPKNVQTTPIRYIVKDKPGPKGDGCLVDAPLKSF